MEELSQKILINNLQKKARISLKGLKKKVGFLEGHVPLNINEVIVSFVSDARIKTINRKFLHKNCFTDVMSFKTGRTGDIIISADTAARQAKDFKVPFETELLYLIIHGILHLSGYTDGNLQDRKEMLSRQDKILDRIMAAIKKE